jgi:hypothetical protein
VTGGWEDLVTTALLGTDRRPIPSEPGAPETDSVDRVLTAAARHRAAVRAGRWLESCPPPERPAPGPAPLPAPPAAQDEINEHLAHGDITQTNAWLAQTAEQGLGLAAKHWVAAADLAARTPRLDRRLLAAVLGPPGLWFVDRNPEWATLALALHTARNEPAE